MSIDLITEEGYQQSRSVGLIEGPQEEIGTFSGSLSAIPLGAKRGLLDLPAEALANFASPYLEDAAQYWFGDNAKEWVAGQTELTREIVRKGQRTQQEMGTVGRLLYSASSVVTAAGVGGFALGPAGAYAGTAAAMAAGGAVTGRERFLELKDQVDEDTATKASYVAAGTMAVGIGLAPYYGIRALTQVASGIGMNVGVGMADRYGTSRILEEAGYSKTAEHYKTLDGMSIAADAVLGAAFPFAARAWRGLNTVDIDAALAYTEARQADTSMPSLPGRPQDIEAQAAAIDNIKEQMFADGKSVYDIVTPPIHDGAPNAKLAGEQMLAAKMLDDYIAADPEMAAFRDIKAEDFDIPTGRSIENVAAKTEGEVQTKVAEDYDAFLSQSAVKIAADRPDAQVSVDGVLVKAADLETRFKEEATAAQQESTLVRIATACAISRG